MDIIDAIKTRKSIRDFRPDSVSRDVIREILDVAVRAPSGLNKQPWEFAVIAGKVLENVKNAYIERIEAEQNANRPRAKARVQDSVYRRRQVELGFELFRLMGIQREDAEKRAEWAKRGYRFFNAPAAIIVLMDEFFPEPGPMVDIGNLIQTICLAALHHGLGTCIENQGTAYPDILRRFTGVPESKRSVAAIAIGYPNWNFPANKIVTTREPVENISSWHGFD